MPIARLLVAATLLSAACTSATTLTLQGEWDAFEVIPVDDGVDERPLAFPYSYEVEAQPGSEGMATETITATIDEANTLTLTSAIKWVASGQAPVTEACHQVGELTQDEEGAWITLLPEAALGETNTCPEADASCTVTDDGMMLECDVFYTDTSATFQDTHLEGLRISFRPTGWVDTGAM